ncbi:hypothetical protein DSL72_006210 [Monilinia vaccinii-corymbosi]|uniref:Uncharacterized protein n=1 Tax=Monilinia vaccinii-corymbosi TaxID=61207 RepID=A0A8A3PI26_9HELO|nr:hypothetical protein DSL72_006210 [Monilinia vaccinii-corymbosi]
MKNDLNIVLIEIHTELNRQHKKIAFLQSIALKRFAVPAYTSICPKPYFPDPKN